MTTFDSPDDWAKGIFTEQEIINLKQAAKDIHEDVQRAIEDDVFADAVSFEMFFRPETASNFLTWTRSVVPTEDDEVNQWLAAIGAAIAFSYLVDENWEMDEVMSDHAAWFGAASMFFDMEGEDDDDT